MQVQVNTGDGLGGKDTLEGWATDFLNDELARFADEITRVEVQMTDEAKGKGSGDDLHCMLEARLNGHAPVAVHHNAENMDEAIRGATGKLVRALDHTLGKLDRHEHRSRDTIRKDPELT
jgi:ribosome-associated translation inhibitor RaiA